MNSKRYDWNLVLRLLPGLVLLAVGHTVALSAEPEAPAAALKVGTNSIPRSTFVDDERGRDPFFPNSSRRQYKAPVPVAATVASPSSLVLLGITGPAERRYALINNQNFLTGEEHRVRIPGGNTLVKCEEIRERSVIVTIQGGSERYEIHLLERTLPLAPEARLLE